MMKKESLDSQVKKSNELDSLRKIRRDLVFIAAKSGEGHIPSSLSVLDLIYVFFSMQFRNQQSSGGSDLPKDSLFVLSKGHAALGLYAVLNHFGRISDSDFQSFCAFESPLGGHPDRNKVPHVRFSTGSLGHGLPMSVGVALARKSEKSRARVFCLVGDGELNEGSNWEAALVASHHKLTNLTCIVDQNDSSLRALNMNGIAKKFEAFGWNSFEISGHEHAEIRLSLLRADKDRPTAIIANTTKGFGITSMENNPAWHHKSPTLFEAEEILKGLR